MLNYITSKSYEQSAKGHPGDLPEKPWVCGIAAGQPGRSLPAPAAVLEGTRHTVLRGHTSQILAPLPDITQFRFLPEKHWHTHLLDSISRHAEGIHMHW